MDQIILSLRKRVLLPVVCLMGVVSWLVFCEAHYKSYWDSTIYRVQTTDFNLLHHTVPVTLSHFIINGQDESIQQVLDSTYGLFGMVVTNPDGTAILYRTSKTYHRRSWQDRVSPDFLQEVGEPYDLLCDPPPKHAVYEHESPRETRAVKVNAQPQGRVLGRVYYLRANPPTFIEDLTGFLASNPFEISAAKRGYLYISLCTFGFSMAFVMLVLWRKRVLEIKQKELESAEHDLEIQGQALSYLADELLAQKARKEWLEEEANLAYKRALGLKGSLESLKDALASQDKDINTHEDERIGQIMVRPAIHPSSAVLEEIESLIPDLSRSGSILKSHAGQLEDYCSKLEARQEEMKKIIDQACFKVVLKNTNVLKFKTR